MLLLGCSNTEDSGDQSATTDRPQVSWQADIAPIVHEKCTQCHQDGGIAPFSMQEYATVKGWASAMADAVEQDLMPPFLAQETDACKPRRPWYDDLRLSDHQKSLLRRWARAGAPEMPRAEATHAPHLPARPIPRLEREDVIMRLPEPIVVSGARDIHTCVVVDPGLEKDSYVVGRTITAGNAKVLHHVVTYVIEPGKTAEGAPRDKSQLEAVLRERKGIGAGDRYDCFGGPGLNGLTTTMLDAWAPGAMPNISPPGSAQLVDKDALVLLDVHYHPTGQSETDADTKLSLMLTDERPELINQIILVGNAQKEREEYPEGVSELVRQPGEVQAEFVIPPDVTDHVEDMSWTFKLPPGFQLKVYAAGTHMHYVGRDMQVRLEHTDTTSDADREECLIQTPKWNFNWQRGYAYDAQYAELPTIKNGDKLKLHCLYDNTMQNRFVAQALHERDMNAPVEVKLGEDTLDEMCVGAIGVLYPNTNPN
ncbi:MAG TPA: hypothetical protein VJV78_17570 [Polyangiales bacterium]|nr:hypothetical protein [Polyangiales bacterium]